MGKGRERGFASFRNALSPEELPKLPKGMHCDGAGLYFIVSGHTKRWVFRYSEYGQTRVQRNLTIGYYPAVSLTEARRLRAAMEKVALSGGDPQQEVLNERQAGRNRVVRYPWKTLKKGEFFDILTFKNVGGAKHLIEYGTKISGHKFSAMSTATGVRVWRIE